MTRLKNKVKAKKRKEKRLKDRQRYDKYIKDLRSKILLFDDPILKQKSEEIKFSWLEKTEDKEIQAKNKKAKGEFEENIKLLRKVLAVTPNGVGLSACQIGILQNIIAIRPDLENKEIIVMINPEIVEFGDKKEVKMEGCLSYPNIYAPIERNKEITAKYVDENSREQQEKCKDIKARIVVHETEHLQGECKVGDVWRRKQQKQEEEARQQQEMN